MLNFFRRKFPVKDRTLIKAIIEVESGGNLEAVGDRDLANKAYGVLQIRQPVIDDVNKKFGTRYNISHAKEPAHAEDIFDKYTSIYATEERLGRKPTNEDIARIWNGGPNGYRKDTTVKYWNKVNKLL